MKRSLFLVISAGILATGIYSCKTTSKTSTPSVNCTEPKPTYTSDIKPILDPNCASSCHSTKNKAGGIDLSSYSGAKSVSGKKKFLGAIRHEKGFEPMPRKHPKLSDDDILKIACWVQGGALQ